LLGATEQDLVPLLEEVAAICTGLQVPIAGVISDGQHSIRKAVAHARPRIPHQLCQYHYLREAAKPFADADRHAKKELKKQVCGVRPIERALEGHTHEEADFCLPEVEGLCLKELVAQAQQISVVVATTVAQARCPVCGPCQV